MTNKKNSVVHSSSSIVIPLFIVIATSISIIEIGSNQFQITAAQQQSQVNLTSVEKQQLLEGISFEIDNVTFSHHTASVNGIQIHYVIGGQGDPIVLLHGWPQTFFLPKKYSSSNFRLVNF